MPGKALPSDADVSFKNIVPKGLHHKTTTSSDHAIPDTLHGKHWADKTAEGCLSACCSSAG